MILGGTVAEPSEELDDRTVVLDLPHAQGIVGIGLCDTLPVVGSQVAEKVGGDVRHVSVHDVSLQ